MLSKYLLNRTSYFLTKKQCVENALFHRKLQEVQRQKLLVSGSLPRTPWGSLLPFSPGRWRHRAQLSVATMSRLPPSQQAQTKRRDLVTEKTLNGERGGVKARLEQAGRWLPTAGKELGCTMPPYPWGMRVLPRAPHPTVWAFVTSSGISLGVQ